MSILVCETAIDCPGLIGPPGVSELVRVSVLLLGCMRKAYPAFRKLDVSSAESRRAYITSCAERSWGVETGGMSFLLEIEPEKQKRGSISLPPKRLLRIQSVCVTKIKKRGRHYFTTAREPQRGSERIYNRVISTNSNGVRCETPFSFQTISMSLGPACRIGIIGSANTRWRSSRQRILAGSSCRRMPTDEEIGDYVLKPLYSFAVSGSTWNRLGKNSGR